MSFIGLNNLYSFSPMQYSFGFGGYTHPSYIQSNGINYFSKTPFQPAATYTPALTNISAPPVNGYPQPQTVQNLPPQMQPQGNGVQIQTDKLVQAQQIYNDTKNSQGVISKLFDGIKNVTGIGLGSKKCAKYINDAQNGIISPDMALEYANKYSSKQKSSLNISSAILASGIAILCSGRSQNARKISKLLTAMAAGALTKATVKGVDRATNNIQNDALDEKLVLKDALQGAINGAITVSCTPLLKTVEGGSAIATVKGGLVNGAKIGIAAGGLSAATDYSTECIAGDEQFSASNLLSNTIQGAAAGGIAGSAAGALSLYTAYRKYGNNGHTHSSSGGANNAPSQNGNKIFHNNAGTNTSGAANTPNSTTSASGAPVTPSGAPASNPTSGTSTVTPSASASNPTPSAPVTPSIATSEPLALPEGNITSVLSSKMSIYDNPSQIPNSPALKDIIPQSNTPAAPSKPLALPAGNTTPTSAPSIPVSGDVIPLPQANIPSPTVAVQPKPVETVPLKDTTTQPPVAGTSQNSGQNAASSTPKNDKTPFENNISNFLKRLKQQIIGSD